MFQCWINTSFLENDGIISIPKRLLDKGCKVKIFLLLSHFNKKNGF